jgi:HSP20 family protein
MIGQTVPTPTVPVATAPATPETPKPRRWEPFEFLTQMQADLDRFWGGRWPEFRLLRRPVEFAEVWTPRADVYEQNGSIVVKAELPGVSKEDIHVTIEEGDLVVQGERKAEEKVEEKDYYRLERSYGSFYRRLPLPEGVTAEQIDATFADGVLQVTVPKPVIAPPEAKTVAIK